MPSLSDIRRKKWKEKHFQFYFFHTKINLNGTPSYPTLEKQTLKETCHSAFMNAAGSHFFKKCPSNNGCGRVDRVAFLKPGSAHKSGM